MGVRARIRDDRGFTLVELLVVSLIIGILAAIALMSLSRQTAKAHDAEAKSNARNIIAVVEACNSRDEDYRNCESSDNPGIRDAGIALGGAPGQVIVTSSDRKSFNIVSRSRSGNIFTLSRTDGDAAIKTCVVAAGGDQGGCSAAPNGTW